MPGGLLTVERIPDEGGAEEGPTQIDISSMNPRSSVEGAECNCRAYLVTAIIPSRYRTSMTGTQILIAQAYAAFNQRDIDGVLALMSENVSWPNAWEGGRADGKEAIRDYWTLQWRELDPRVEPIEVIDHDGGITAVRVHQVVKDRAGEVLFDGEVWHVYTIANGLIERMDVKEGEPGANQTSSAGFAKT